MGAFINLARFKRFLNTKSKTLLCESLVLSRFNYCDTVYVNIDMYLQKKVQRIQDICLRFIFDIRKSDKCNYNELRGKLGWLTMNERRKLHCLTMMYKILNGNAPNYLKDMFTLQNEIHNSNTRSSRRNLIWVDKGITSKVHRNSFKFYAPTQYNKLPEEIKNCNSVASFKSNLSKYLRNK